MMVATYLMGFYRTVESESLRYHHVEMVEFVNNTRS